MRPVLERQQIEINRNALGCSQENRTQFAIVLFQQVLSWVDKSGRFYDIFPLQNSTKPVHSSEIGNELKLNFYFQWIGHQQDVAYLLSYRLP